jgi:hypothetical protein
MKKSNDIIWDRNRDLPAYREVPQPTAPPGDPPPSKVRSDYKIFFLLFAFIELLVSSIIKQLDFEDKEICPGINFKNCAFVQTFLYTKAKVPVAANTHTVRKKI